MTEMGESLVGSYLRHIRGAELVLYNERTDAQGEIDVIGVRGGAEPEVWLCEVATHIAGLGYGASFAAMTAKITSKLDRAAAFATRLFPEHVVHLEFWAPYVATGRTTAWMDTFVEEKRGQGVDVGFVVNADYTAKVQELVDAASATTSTTSEPAFRLLQVLTHVRGSLRLGPS